MTHGLTKSLASLCLALGLLLVLPARSAAWGGEGHRIVAKIAKWRLEQLRDNNNDARAARALARMQHIFAADADIPQAPSNIESASIWPDNVRSVPRYRFARPLHFVSIPLNPAQDRDRYVAASHCRPGELPEGDCSVGALEHYRKVLLDSDDPEELLEALSFVIHFLGDLHQPLHNAEQQQFENDEKYDGGLGPGLGDKGGNLRYVFYLNHQLFNSSDPNSCDVDRNVCTDFYPSGAAIKNLHATWDKHMIQTEMATYRRPGTQQKAKSTEAKYATFLQGELPANPAAARYAEIEAGGPAAWAEEAHDLAEKNAYDMPGPRPKTFPADGTTRQFFSVRPSYRNQNIRIVESQLQKGGVRLASFLMQSFD